MKILRLTLVAAIALGATAFSACSNENEVTKSQETLKSDGSIVFSLNLPVGDPLVFTRGIYNQDDSEAALKSLRMFEFYADTEVLVASKDIDVDNDLTATAGSYEYTYTPGTGYTDSRARRFIFIANDGISLTAGETIDDLMGKLATQSLADDDPDTNIWNAGALPMTGEAITGGSNVIPIDLTADAPTAVSVDLVRAVARIDIVNFTPKLEIKKIKLVKVNPKSYILPHLDAAGKVVVPTGMTKVNDITPFRTYDNGTLTTFRIPDTKIAPNGTVGIADTLHLNKAFYVYEEAEAADELSALHLQITGELQGVDVFYNIPFWKSYLKDETPSDAPLEILRNHIYTVYIGDGSKPSINTSIKMSIQVKDWKRQNVTDDFDDDIFKNSSTDANVTGYERATQTFTLANAAITSDFGLKISDDYTNIVINTVEVLTGNDWLTAGCSDGKNIALTAAVNTGDSRVGSIRVTYTITPTTGSSTQHKTVFSFKQAGV